MLKKKGVSPTSTWKVAKTRSEFFSLRTWLLLAWCLSCEEFFAPAWVRPCCNHSNYPPQQPHSHLSWRHTRAGSSRSCWCLSWTLTYTQALSCSGRCTLATHKPPQRSAWSARCPAAGSSLQDCPRPGTLSQRSLSHQKESHRHY